MTALPAATIMRIDQDDITRGHAITAKFAGMSEEQDFTIYAGKTGDTSIVIESDTRIGEIFLDSGVCRLSQHNPNGIFFLHLAMANDNSVIQEDDLIKIKDAIRKALA